VTSEKLYRELRWPLGDWVWSRTNAKARSPGSFASQEQAPSSLFPEKPSTHGYITVYHTSTGLAHFETSLRCLSSDPNSSRYSSPLRRHRQP